jgi:hypothetical protein
MYVDLPSYSVQISDPKQIRALETYVDRQAPNFYA